MSELNGTNKPIDATTDGIKVEGHRGTWYVLDEVIFEGKSYFLLEHETYGEDADHIAVDSTGFNIFSHITDGTDEILERLIELAEADEV